jgi:(p)ppGpp synthase/HD superfamily hydrolase
VDSPSGDRLLERAFAFATRAHGQQVRKGTTIPYVSHLMAVAALVLEDGGGLEDAAAGRLHDVVEDTDVSLEDLGAEFGANIARLVQGCTDSLVSDDKAPWRERKEAYLARLVAEPPSVLRISVADKLHNARSILDDVRRDGPHSLDRFSGKIDGTLWYYRSLARTYGSIPATSRWLPELNRVVDELHVLTIDQGS